MLVNVCRSIEPFNVELTGLKFFKHPSHSYTLWLSPEPKASLVQLQKALMKVTPDCDDLYGFKGGFTPHLNLGQIRKLRTLKKLQEEFSKEWKPVTFTVKEVCLVWRGQPPQDVFQVGERVPLGKSGFS